MYGYDRGFVVLRGSVVLMVFMFSVFTFTFAVFTVFAVTITSTATLHLTRAIVAFRDGMSDDGCNGSSSKNNSNGKFHLNHFEVMKCEVRGLAINAKVVCSTTWGGETS